MMSILQYFIRSYLEDDAMIKAKYLAKDYMNLKQNLISKENVEKVIENYDKMNSIGIKFYNFNLLTKVFIKVIIYCLVAIAVRYLI